MAISADKAQNLLDSATRLRRIIRIHYTVDGDQVSGTFNPFHLDLQGERLVCDTGNDIELGDVISMEILFTEHVRRT